MAVQLQLYTINRTELQTRTDYNAKHSIIKGNPHIRLVAPVCRIQAGKKNTNIECVEDFIGRFTDALSRRIIILIFCIAAIRNLIFGWHLNSQAGATSRIYFLQVAALVYTYIPLSITISLSVCATKSGFDLVKDRARSNIDCHRDFGSAEKAGAKHPRHPFQRYVLPGEKKARFRKSNTRCANF